MDEDSQKLVKEADLQKIATEGAQIYKELKFKYESEYNGQFLAIDINSKNAYLGKTSSDALDLARTKHPGNIFYVVRIGHDVAETLSETYFRPRQN